MDDTQPSDPAALAREAMERARAAARQRGARQRSPRLHHADRLERQRSTQPFEAGRDPAPVSLGVDHFLRRMGWAERIEVAAVTARWRDLVGDAIADHTTVMEFDDGVLSVQASSTAWATQLAMMKGQIIHTINEELGNTLVQSMTVLGPQTRRWTHGSRRVPGRGPRDTYG